MVSTDDAACHASDSHKTIVAQQRAHTISNQTHVEGEEVFGHKCCGLQIALGRLCVVGQVCLFLGQRLKPRDPGEHEQRVSAPKTAFVSQYRDSLPHQSSRLHITSQHDLLHFSALLQDAYTHQHTTHQHTTHTHTHAPT